MSPKHSEDAKSFDGGVAESRNAPVAPGEVQGSRPAASVEQRQDVLRSAVSQVIEIVQQGHNEADVSEVGLALPLLDQVADGVRRLQSDLADTRAELARWQEAYGV